MDGSRVKQILEVTSIVSGLIALIWVAGMSFEKKADAVEVNAMNVRLSVMEAQLQIMDRKLDKIDAKLPP